MFEIFFSLQLHKTWMRLKCGSRVAAWSCVPDRCDRESESTEPTVTRQKQTHI